MAYNYHSIKNQGILRDFVDKEVYCNATTEVEFILGVSVLETPAEAPYCTEDIENLYINKSDEIEEVKSEIYHYEQLIDEMEEEEDVASVDEYRLKIEELEDKIEELKAEDGSMAEVMEWWRVSPFLAKKLADWGEPVIMDYAIWGRTTTGQALYMDYEIAYICKELGILEEDEEQ